VRGERSGGLALAAVLIVAAILRLWGIDFGLPHTLTRPDEEAVASVALRFFRRTLDPAFFDWPSLFMYAVAIGYAIYFNIGRLAGWFPYEASFISAAASRPGPLYLIARGLSAAAGVLTVDTVYRIGVRLFDRATALLGAAFLAVAALHVRDSHFGLTDVAATWLLSLSFLFTVRFFRGGHRSDALLSAMWAGLAASTKYNAGLIVLPGVWAIVSASTTARVRLLLSYAAIAAAAFVAGTPYAVIDGGTFLTALRSISAHLEGGHAALAGRAWGIHLASSLRYGLGLPMLAAGIGGFVLLCWRDRRTGVLFVMFPLAYFVLIGAGRTAFARHIVPTLPFLCMAAAFVTVEAATAISRWTYRPVPVAAVTWVLAGLVAAPSAWSAIQTDRLLSRTDSRLLAAQWIRDQFPGGATFYQSGSIYGRVQMQTAGWQSSDRYPVLNFDDASAAFYKQDGSKATAPDLLIVTRCPLSYCDPPAALPKILEQYVPLRRLPADDANQPGVVYDLDDAFFVPLSGFGAVSRPGPDLLIYARKR